MLEKTEIMTSCKKQLKICCDILESMNEDFFDNKLKKPLQKAFIDDLICITLYFAASDRVVSKLETAFLNTLFDCKLTGEQYLEICLENDIYSSDFENKEVATLSIIQMVEKSTKENIGLCHSFIEVIKRISAELLKIDTLHEQEVEDFELYFSKLDKRYK